MKKEDEAKILATAFENQLRSLRFKFESTIKSNIKSLKEDIQPIKEADERKEKALWYKNNLGDALYRCAYDQAETLWSYTNRIAEYLKIEKNLDQYETWEIKETFRSKVTMEFDEAITEIETIEENLPFY